MKNKSRGSKPLKLCICTVCFYINSELSMAMYIYMYSCFESFYNISLYLLLFQKEEEKEKLLLTDEYLGIVCFHNSLVQL